MLLIVLTMLAYLPALRGGFVWDDDLHVLNNAITRPDGLYRSWFTVEQPNYWPITWSAFWAEYRLFGLHPAGYHVVNVLVHSLNAVLLAFLLIRLGIAGAWAVALLFALHPVNVETAAWITQLKTLLAMCFGLMSALFYVAPKNRRVFYAVALGVYALSLLSKPAMVGLPFILLLIHWWQGERITLRTCLRLAPFLFLALVCSLLEMWFQSNRSIAGATIRTGGFLPKMAGAGWAAWFYALKAFVPYPLMPIYPKWDIRVTDLLAWLPLLALMGVFLLLWFQQKRIGRGPFVCAAVYMVLLAPILGLVDVFYMKYAPTADHYQYSSLPALLILGVSAGRVVIGRRVKTAYTALLAMSLTYAVLDWQEQAAYFGLEQFYREALRENQNAWLAHNNLGELRMKERRFSEAKYHLERAMKLEPAYEQAYANYAAVLAAEGRTDDAVAYLHRASQLVGTLFEPHNRLGETFMKLGRTREAEAEFRKAIELRPDFAGAYDNLGQLALRTGDPEQAVQHFRKAVDLVPQFANAHEHLASTYIRLNRTGDALAAYRKAIAAIPGAPELQNNYAAALAQTGDLDQAISALRATVKQHPGFAPAHKNLGALLARQGNTSEAKAHLQTALFLSPRDNEARMLLQNMN